MYESLKTAQKNAYKKKGIESDEEILRFLPRKYKDYRVPGLLPANAYSVPEEGLDMAVPAQLVSVKTNEKNGRPYTTVKAKDRAGTEFSAMFMNTERVAGYIASFAGTEILFMGVFKYDRKFGYSTFNPTWTANVSQNLKIVPVYSKIKGVADQTARMHLNADIYKGEEDTIPYRLSSGLIKINDAFQKVHHPETLDDIKTGTERLVLDDLVYMKAVMKETAGKQKTAISFKKRDGMDAMINRLPYALTNDQKKTIDTIIENTKKGVTVNALVQGDVGCGKTIIAFLLMRCAAENGFQSVLMAPTQILAEQHYNELKTLVSPEKIAFFSGSVKAKDKREMIEKIKDGSIEYVVGTGAVLTAGIEFKSLGLAIVDEEHRFGVEQRNGILKSAIHKIIMSATPIPRSLAKAAYGDDTDVFQIIEKPAGRKPVITYYDDGTKIDGFLYKCLKTGMQAYVVCPLKEEADQESVTAGLKSAEEVYTDYKKKFEPLGFPVSVVTGDTKAEEKDKVISEFQQGKTTILVSTTVIEVGVNVPNANIIIVQNAERFGLATLHQLRGRVGRGDKQAYCILVSEDNNNNRIRVMCSTNDGFQVAEADLLERRSGDFLGTKQSGKNKLVEELLSYPDIARKAEEIVNEMLPAERQKHIEKYAFLQKNDN